jgi:ABC-type sugar transport system permease subunit
MVAMVGRQNREASRSGPAAGVLPYLLLLPGLLIVGAFTVMTLTYTAVVSFTNLDFGELDWQFIGFGNYVRASVDPLMISSLLASLVFVSSVVILSVALGFIIAVGLNRKFAAQGFMRGVVVVPWVISELATGVFWSLLLATDGLLGSLLGGPLNTAWGAMVSLILVEVWRSVGFVTVMVLASLQTVDQTLYEAARVDGATRTRMLRSITIPLVTPSLVIASILLTIGNFNLVTVIIALTGGGPITATTTTALYMYQQSFIYFHIGYGSAIAIVMSILNVSAMLLFMFVQRNVGMRQ